MKKSVLNEIKKLVEKFNEKNSHLEREYIIKNVCQFKRGHYALNIEYNVFFCSDLMVLVDFVKTNNLHMFLGSFSDGKAYIDLQ